MACDPSIMTNARKQRKKQVLSLYTHCDNYYIKFKLCFQKALFTEIVMNLEDLIVISIKIIPYAYRLLNELPKLNLVPNK